MSQTISHCGKAATISASDGRGYREISVHPHRTHLGEGSPVFEFPKFKVQPHAFWRSTAYHFPRHCLSFPGFVEATELRIARHPDSGGVGPDIVVINRQIACFEHGFHPRSNFQRSEKRRNFIRTHFEHCGDTTAGNRGHPQPTVATALDVGS